MAGDKTHQQQIDIIEKRVDTSNAGDDFDARADLEKSEALKRHERGNETLKPDVDIQNDSRSMPRGLHQESEHDKS